MQTYIPLSLSARLFLLVAILLMPLTAMAQTPSVVTSIKAWEQDGQVHVGWQKLPDTEHVAYYRIFFSSKSILGNNGLYDDFDIADTQTDDHVLANAPQIPTLYFSVLAVNDQGEESPTFAEEASLKRGEGDTPPSASSGPSSEPISTPEPVTEGASSGDSQEVQPTNDTLTILSVEAQSSTGVLITFSLPVTLDPDQAKTAFDVRDGSGQTLAITRLVITGNTAMIHTIPQDMTKVYQLHVSALQGQRSDGSLIALDASQDAILFAGYNGPDAITAPPMPPPTNGELVTVRLRGEADGQGRYSVEAAWETQSSGFAQWRIAQTIDHGMTFSPAQILPGTALGVRIPGVPSGELGLGVQGVSTDGRIIASGLAYIRLGYGPQIPAQVMPPQQPVMQKPIQTGLPQSGIGAWVGVSLLGAAGGLALIRRKRVLA